MTLYLEAQSFILHQSLNLIINDTNNKQPTIHSRRDFSTLYGLICKETDFL